MIEILIGDDNKVSLKTTNEIAETEIAATIVVETMRNLKKPEPDVKFKLVLVGMDVLFNRFDPSVVQVKVIDDKEWV